MTFFVRYDPTSGKIIATGNMDVSHIDAEIALGNPIAITYAPTPLDGTCIFNVTTKQLEPAPVVTPAPPTLQATQATMLANLASVRYTHEVGGIVWQTNSYPTDRDTQSKYEAMSIMLLRNLVTSVNWKLSNGTWVTLTPSQFGTLTNNVALFVQGCFNNEQAISAAISSATSVAALSSIDVNSGWPANTFS